uniref:Uncharacterized protein n=1 Tax=Ananas comosus var. bracteatus TaxID=296719 RepID=A0A6V7NXM2_ANACO|nr:unnamed protein product [Ananas comosus var. bracteatus]
MPGSRVSGRRFSLLRTIHSPAVLGSAFFPRSEIRAARKRARGRRFALLRTIHRPAGLESAFSPRSEVRSFDPPVLFFAPNTKVLSILPSPSPSSEDALAPSRRQCSARISSRQASPSSSPFLNLLPPLISPCHFTACPVNYYYLFPQVVTSHTGNLRKKKG